MDTRRAVVTALALSLLAACGTTDGRPVTATATAMLDRARLPFGSPLETRFVFERTEESVAIEGPYRVFVHYTDPDGGLLWSDDHDLPMPVEDWRPGEPVTWTRAFFLPPVPYLGPVQLRAGLFNPDTGVRLRLGAEPVGQDAYRLATFEVTAQTHPLEFVEGWHEIETPGGVGMEQWRWSRDTATLAFVRPDEDLTLHLDLDRPGPLPEPQVVQVLLGETVLDEFVLPAGERVRRQVALPTAALGGAVTQALVISASPTFVPAEVGLGSDTRELGVRVFHAVLLPDP